MIASTPRISVRRLPVRFDRIASFLGPSLLGASLVILSTASRAELPVQSQQWLASGGAQINAAISNSTNLVIDQQTDRITLNWDSFNVSADSTVTFRQPGSTSVALNRIFQNDPSRIFGSLNANGQVYLINRNGFLFGPNSRINVNTLIATSLDLTQEAIENGISQAINSNAAAFAGDGRVFVRDQQGDPIEFAVDLDGNLLRRDDGALIPLGDAVSEGLVAAGARGQNVPVNIQIEAGSRISAVNGGRLMMLAPEVINYGDLNAPDGQVILAAGQTVYLAQASEGSGLRGFLVEVDVGGTVINGDAVANNRITNPDELVGKIIADRGNVTLIGLGVNQNGLVSANSAVQQNGSIRLLARDTSNFNGVSNSVPDTSRTGDIVLGRNSVSQVLPENDPDAVTADVTEQPLSTIEMVGDRVVFGEDSLVRAPSGDISVTALDNPSLGLTNATGSRIVVESGAVIDVSGEVIDRPFEDNILTVDLRADELKDRPLQKNGILRGADIVVDIRQRGVLDDGTPWEGTPVADISGSVDSIQRTARQRSLVGGNISLRAEGDIIIKPGATLDVSGGAINYAGGRFNTTRLFANNQLFDISNADPNLRYTDIVDRDGLSERFYTNNVPAYVEGKDAGTLTFSGQNQIIAGDLRGNAQVGRFQRNAPSAGLTSRRFSDNRLYRPTDEVPLGGRLVIGENRSAGGTDADFGIRNVIFGEYDLPEIPGLTDLVPDALNATLYLSPELFTLHGINRLDVSSNEQIQVPKDVTLRLSPGGELEFTTGSILVDGAISVPGGDISLKGLRTVSSTTSGITLGSQAVLDTAGLWVNENPLLTHGAPQGALFIDGGSISLDANVLTSSTGSRIDVSGGARLDEDGKISGGDGGDINFAGTLDNLGSQLSGFGVDSGEGGSLSFELSRDLSISSTNIDADALRLAPDFFSVNGFSSFEISAPNISLTGGTRLSPQVRFLQLSGTAFNQPTGSDPASFSTRYLRPDYDADPVLLALDAAVEINLEESSQVTLSPGSVFTARSDQRVVVAGGIDVPGGSIILTQNNFNIQNIPDIARRTGVFVEPTAQLSARGNFRTLPSDIGLRTADVFDAGLISLESRQGYLVTAPGSRIDVSGTSRILDLGVVPQASLVAARAGRIRLDAAEGILLYGDLQAGAAEMPGVPGQKLPGASGGTLEVLLGNDPGNSALNAQRPGNSPIPLNARQIILTDRDVTALPSGFKAGDDIPDVFNGKAVLNSTLLKDSGIDSLRATAFGLVTEDTNNTPVLAANSELFLEGDFDISLRNELMLDVSRILGDGGSASLRANTISIGSSSTNPNISYIEQAKTGNGLLDLFANFIDIIGNLQISEMVATTFSSAGDIRFRGLEINDKSGEITGQLTSAGNLSFSAAQLYTPTLTDFTVTTDETISVGSDGLEFAEFVPEIRITSNGNTPFPVLSAGSRLAFEANRIEQAGIVKAPLGEVAFIGRTLVLNEGDATAEQTLESTVILGDDSVTSVSAEGLIIPFGQLQAGSDLVVNIGDITREFGLGTEALPQKQITLLADNVDTRDGALMDVSGDSGDLFSYEYIGGANGTQDLLSSFEQPATFAILPGLNPAVAPVDPIYADGSSLSPGDAVYLETGIAGLPAGVYTLLPARYGLLPGAYVVSESQTLRDIPTGQLVTFNDGSTQVGGRRVVRGTNIVETRNRAYRVTQGSEYILRDNADDNGLFARYDTRLVSPFITSQALDSGDPLPFRLPTDSGVVSLTARRSLLLDASLRQTNLFGTTLGRGPVLDIASDRIAVVNSALEGQEGFLNITAQRLEAFGAESLLLGGRRTNTSDGVVLDVVSSEIRVGVDVDLELRELLLAGTDNITLESGASIRAIGEKTVDQTVNIEGDGALLVVSGLGNTTLNRQASPGTRGVLTLEEGVVLSADEAVLLDASLDTDYSAASIDVSDGALTLGASRISLSETAPAAGTSGLALSGSEINALNAATLIFNSRSSVDVSGNILVAGRNLTIQAAGINGSGNADDVTLAAEGVLRLENPAEVQDGSGSGSGQLTLSGGAIELGQGDFSVDGFSTVNLLATNGLTLAGDGSFESVADTYVEAQQITGAAGVDYRFEVTQGDLLLASPANLASIAADNDFGARLEFSAAGNLTIATQILNRSGIVSAEAGGTLSLEQNGLIDVSGIDLDFGGLLRGAPGGDITLSAGQDILLASGGRLNVAGSDAGSDAGSLSLSAENGVIELASELDASAQPGYEGGRFTLGAGSFVAGQFTDLNSRLDLAGFSGARSIRLREGDIAVTNDMRAHQLRLIADAGAIDVSATLDASGEQAGAITLAARDDVVLSPTARLDASATGENEHGGRIFIGTRSGVLDLQAGSSLNVSGDASSGKVTLRAPRIDSNGDGTADDIAIFRVDSTFEGARRVDAEAYQDYDFTSVAIDAGSLAPVRAETDNFMNNAGAIKTRLGRENDPVFHLTPGIELRSDSDLVLAEDLDLFGWQFAGEPGYLTLRAQGDLPLNGKLSDGFESVTTTVSGPFGTSSTQVSNVLGARESWSYRLVAGADLSSADPLVSLAQDQLAVGAGNIQLLAGQRVRTGTGDIEFSATRNISLGDSGSAVYTAGKDGGGVPLRLLGAARYATEGGNLVLNAGGDIIGAANRQQVNDWLWRTGGELVVFSLFPRSEEVQAVGWAVDHDSFNQNLGALGGGNVNVFAAGNVRDLSVSIPTIGRQLGGTDLSASVVEVDGGGNFMVRAGGDISGGRYFIGRGDGSLISGGSITEGSDSFSPILAFAGGSYSLDARRDLSVDGFVHPTLLPRSTEQIQSAGGIPVQNSGFYVAYSPDNAVALMSRAGNVSIESDTTELAKSFKPKSTPTEKAAIKQSIGLQLTPPTLSATAFQGNVAVNDPLTLLPASRGNLELLARETLAINARLRLSDADRTILGDYTSPIVDNNTNPRTTSTTGNLTLNELGSILSAGGADRFNRDHALIPVHSDIAQPVGSGPDNSVVRLVARNGDIRFNQNTGLELAKAFRIEAGRDIVGLSVNAQHIRESDISLVKAGRDLIYPIRRDSFGGISNELARLVLGGPGRLDIITGRDFNLGTSGGVLTVGNTVNLALSDSGADISLAVGVDGKRDFSAFIDAVFAEPSASRLTGTEDPFEAQGRVNEGLYDFVAAFGEELVANVSDDLTVSVQEWVTLGLQERMALFANLDSGRLLAQYQALGPQQLAFVYEAGLQSQAGGFNPAAVTESVELLATLRSQDQQGIVYRTFYNELTASGREATVSGSDDFSRGFVAAELLFPQRSVSGGDASLFFSQLRTVDGGDIAFMVPGGDVNAGLSTPPSDFGLFKGNDELGVVAQRSGDIDVFLEGDFLVNESRVFAADGGNILMWSSQGDVDAGRGAKTAITAPPPTISFDADGNLQVEFPPALAGSGIRAFVSTPGLAPGNVDLFAPRGIVNAADAGIGSAGNVTIGAREILGADNIDIGGVAVGVPSAGVGGIATGISGLSNATDAATRTAANSAGNVGDKSREGFSDKEVALMSVEVLGFGECEEGAKDCK